MVHPASAATLVAAARAKRTSIHSRTIGRQGRKLFNALERRRKKKGDDDAAKDSSSKVLRRA